MFKKKVEKSIPNHSNQTERETQLRDEQQQTHLSGIIGALGFLTFGARLLVDIHFDGIDRDNIQIGVGVTIFCFAAALGCLTLAYRNRPSVDVNDESSEARPLMQPPV